MEEDSEHYENLIAALDRAMLCIDWDGETFYESVDDAHKVLMTELDRLEKHTNITVNAIGHTHIDVAWLWRLKHTREKAQRSFATVLRLMEQYDEYVFLQTQPQLYQFIKEDCPEMYEQIQRKVAEDKWEGIDGTEILTYFIETPEVGQTPKQRFSTYNGLMTPHAVIGNWKKFKNKGLTKEEAPTQRKVIIRR